MAVRFDARRARRPTAFPRSSRKAFRRRADSARSADRVSPCREQARSSGCAPGPTKGRAGSFASSGTAACRRSRRRPTSLQTPRLSPDGRRLAVVARSGVMTREIRVLDAAQPDRVMLTIQGGDNQSPAWRDSRRLTFGSNREGLQKIYVVSVDQKRPPVPLFTADATVARNPASWARASARALRNRAGARPQRARVPHRRIDRAGRRNRRQRALAEPCRPMADGSPMCPTRRAGTRCMWRGSIGPARRCR